MLPAKSLEQALKLAAVFDDGGDGADAESARGVVWILRALLDATAVLGEIDLTPKRLAHAEIVIEQQNNLIASLRAELVESYRVAAQPQGEPVDDCETFEYQLDMLGPIDRCNVSCGSYGDKYHQWHDAGPYVEYEDHVKHIELYKREVDRLSKLYAEQPAPVSVVLPKRRDFSPQSDSEWGWNACLDEVARLTATVRIPEPLVMTDGLHTYEYVTGHNAAIDKMLGVKS